MKNILIISLLIFGSASSQYGDLDLTFADGGILELPEYKEAIYVDVDSEQNIYCIAKTQTNENYILKTTPDGEIDTSFGDVGSVFFERKQVDIFLTEDKILSLGYFQINNNTTVEITSLNSDGAINESFGNNGVFSHTYQLGGSPYLGPVEIWEYDGGYLIGCYKLQTAAVFIKVLEDGTLDTNYGDNGILEVSLDFSYIAIRDFKQDEDGNVYICAYEPGNQKVEIIKINEQGTLDSDFGENGGVTINFYPCAFGNSDRYSSINIFNGYIYVVGETSCQSTQGGYRRTFIAKLDAVSGELDISYGTDGYFFFYPTYGGYDSLMQENGQIIVSGLHHPQYPEAHTKLYRISVNGTLLNTNTFDYFSAIYYSLAFQGADSFIAAGRTPGNNLIISRHNSWPLSIEDNEWNNDLVIFPNPTQQNFTINTTQQINRIKIFNITGQLQRNLSVAETYSIADLSNGIYFVQIEFTDGSIAAGKIMKN